MWRFFLIEVVYLVSLHIGMFMRDLGYASDDKAVIVGAALAWTLGFIEVTRK